ncbi:MAG: LOG family protein [Vulcanimicrobiaceae bacterium]
MPRLCVFCGARSGHDRTFDPVVRDVASAIVRAGYGIVYGGGRVGLMGTLADAALAAGGEVIGVIPEALERAEIAHNGITQLHVVSSMHERKALMADLSDGFIALPGGVGTMDEFCEILTWRQLGIHDKPIGLLNADGFYDQLIALFDRMLELGFLADPARKLFVAEPAIEALLDHFAG